MLQVEFLLKECTKYSRNVHLRASIFRIFLRRHSPRPPPSIAAQADCALHNNHKLHCICLNKKDLRFTQI